MEWIDVKDRLPDNRTFILCKIDAIMTPIVLEYKHGCYFNGLERVIYITHWMPLPPNPTQTK